jgi:crossover junction endodeoxyribonuclease RuvC
MTCILGIDPGSRVTGYGVIDDSGGRWRYLDSGSIRTQGNDMPRRLAQILSGVQGLVRRFRPDAAVIEQVFMARNPDSALKLGQARGAAICALVPHIDEIAEYSAREVKQAIVGTGGADKVQVQHMVRALLSLSGTPPADAADALALALCHAHQRQTRQRLAVSGSRPA